MSGSPDRPDSDAIVRLLRDFALCYECTTCASACPAFQTDPSRNPRKLFSLLQRGCADPAVLIDSAWWCCTCYSCEVYCPQGVPLTTLFYALKRMSYAAGTGVPQNVRLAVALQASGFGFEVSGRTAALRKSLGLPELITPDVNEIGALIASVRDET